MINLTINENKWTMPGHEAAFRARADRAVAGRREGAAIVAARDEIQAAGSTRCAIVAGLSLVDQCAGVKARMSAGTSTSIRRFISMVKRTTSAPMATQPFRASMARPMIDSVPVKSRRPSVKKPGSQKSDALRRNALGKQRALLANSRKRKSKSLPQSSD
jgi:hypothetical protein